MFYRNMRLLITVAIVLTVTLLAFPLAQPAGANIAAGHQKVSSEHSSGVAPDTTTPNPTCGSGYGEIACVQASPTGLTPSWAVTTDTFQEEEISYMGFNGGESGTQFFYWSGGNYIGTIVVLPPNEYTGYVTIATATTLERPIDIPFDLIVASSDPPPPTSPPIASQAVGIAPTGDGKGYWVAWSDGVVQAFGDAKFWGDSAQVNPNQEPGGANSFIPNEPIVGIAPAATGQGYWLDATDGGIFGFGTAKFYGSMGGKPLNQPMVSMTPTDNENGYWTVAADGGIFSFGSAQFHGSMGGKPLNQPMVGMAADPTTGGYWTVAADGGMFSFGASFFGSTGSLKLNKPIVEMEATSDGLGYRLVASDGGIFCFGDAKFFGSAGGQPIPAPIAGMAADGVNGYWLLGATGTIYAYGGAINYGNGSPA